MKTNIRHFCLRRNKSSEIPRALQTGIYLQCNGNSKTFCRWSKQNSVRFYWGHKPPKIKYTTLIKTRQEGGLEMKYFALFNKALKLNWVKRLCSNSDAPWQYIAKSLLANVGGPELFKCNYDIGHLNLSKCLPAFYRRNSFQPKKQKWCSWTDSLE